MSDKGRTVQEILNNSLNDTTQAIKVIDYAHKEIHTKGSLNLDWYEHTDKIG